MGNDSDNTFIGGILYMNGEPIGWLDEIREVTFNQDESSDGENRLLRLSDMSMTFSGKIKYPHMSRKRFVKALVSRGVTKKRAKRMARETISIKKSYSRILFEHMIGLIK